MPNATVAQTSIAVQQLLNPQEKEVKTVKPPKERSNIVKSILMVLITSATVAGAQTYCWTNFASGGSFSGAYGATVDSDGTIYAAALSSGSLMKITPAGVVTVLGASVPAPVELVVSTNTHNLYVSSLSTRIVKIVPPYEAGDTSQ